MYTPNSVVGKGMLRLFTYAYLCLLRDLKLLQFYTPYSVNFKSVNDMFQN
jgi:hypothetical protein